MSGDIPQNCHLFNLLNAYRLGNELSPEPKRELFVSPISPLFNTILAWTSL